MQTTVVTRVRIGAKPEAVFEYLSNLKYHYLWNPQIYKISPLRRLKLGSVYNTESIVLGMTIQARNEVTSLTPQKELAIENNIGMVRYSAKFRLNPDKNSTKVTCSITVSASSKAAIFSLPILNRLARHELQTDMSSSKNCRRKPSTIGS